MDGCPGLRECFTQVLCFEMSDDGRPLEAVCARLIVFQTIYFRFVRLFPSQYTVKAGHALRAAHVRVNQARKSPSAAPAPCMVLCILSGDSSQCSFECRGVSPLPPMLNRCCSLCRVGAGKGGPGNRAERLRSTQREGRGRFRPRTTGWGGGLGQAKRCEQWRGAAATGIGDGEARTAARRRCRRNLFRRWRGERQRGRRSDSGGAACLDAPSFVKLLFGRNRRTAGELLVLLMCRRGRRRRQEGWVDRPTTTMNELGTVVG